MGSLIDASVLIAAERRQLDLDAQFSAHEDESFALAAITASELLHGVQRATRAHKGKRKAFVEGLLARLPVLPFDLVAARIHAVLWADLSSRGVSMGAHDLIIGATAIALGWDVVTRDERSFPKIPGLEVDRW